MPRLGLMVAYQHIGGLPRPDHDAQFYDGVLARRLIAFVLDTVAIALLGGVLATLFGVATLGLGFFVLVPVMAAVGFFYRWLSIARGSATPGMALVGIELRRGDGARFGAPEALLHTVLFYLVFMSVVLQIASVVMMLMSPYGRGLHDLPLGSTAINRPA